ncbi:CpaF family protein [Streptomyces sp. PSKA54]|uniref:CpaF family protein n=1 Tax=Streptomyces himalayensis subsp. aureolus TaxID=2758039 RepID=A0A7W2HJK8_9ACTN|nr:CpaF/VirB11 family protein [Streptomyces himalayensis]MBA4866222.1 CpaF family protein [Streptomyces himalayensis subsp. aureolus]
MRGRPVHADPTVRRFVSGPQQGRPRQATVAPTGAASSAQPLGVAVPQVTVDYKVARHIATQVAKQREELLKTDPAVDRAGEEQRCLRWINDQVALWSEARAVERGVSPTPQEDDALRRAVYDLLYRAGRLQPYLDDERVEDIFIQGHDEVWLDYGDGQRQRVGPVADSEDELLELLRELARDCGHSERTISTANPTLALSLKDGSRLQAITGLGPKTYAVIRRHRVEHADLGDMVRLGAIDPILKEFLAACVRAEKNVMIAGKQKAGKTTLLRAMLKEFDPECRFATIQTEDELFAHTDGYHRQVVSLVARQSNGEMDATGRGAGEVTLLDLMHPALRMSLERIVVGEVRGPEVVAMMQALTNGAGGNLCTIHARRADIVFDRIAELYALAQGNLSEQLAYRQIANGLDFIVYVSMTDESQIGGRRHRYVSHVMEVTGIGELGRPATNEIFSPGVEFGEVRAVPRMDPGCIDDLRRVGFDSTLLQHPYGAWQAPLPLKVGVGR